MSDPMFLWNSFFVTGVDPKSPPLSPVANFTYSVDIFLQGERVREPLYTNIQYQRINLQGSLQGRSPGGDDYFEFHASNSVNSNLNFIPIKKDGCEEYLKEKLRLSCVLISSRYSRYDPTPYRKRAWGLFSSSCNPISVTTNKKRVEAVYETVMPKLSYYCNCSYTEMVKFKVKVKCGWKGGEEDKFYVKCIEFRMEDMNGKHFVGYVLKSQLQEVGKF
ncbi:hypothetical protein QL285_090984 [Trifolium repens]|nr:hypothetical protein QL285_090984 [Trifolium repens]